MDLVPLEDDKIDKILLYNIMIVRRMSTSE